MENNEVSQVSVRDLIAIRLWRRSNLSVPILCNPWRVLNLFQHRTGLWVAIFHFLFFIGPAFGMDPWADTVYLFEPGPDSGFGMDFFPENVLGPPDSLATDCQPSFRPEEILTLGRHGMIVLGFTNNIIINGVGPDFTVFENAFYIGCDTNNVWAEPGIVAVSQDGENFLEFLYDSTTLEGLAGMTPTTGEDPLDPDVSGGDAFDLADVGISWASYVRITDAGNLVPSPSAIFDLDAVVAVHSSPPLGVEENGGYPLNPLNHLEQNFPNPFRFETLIRYSIPHEGQLSVYNLSGQRVFSTLLSPQSQVFHFRGEGLPAGLYFYEIQSNRGTPDSGWWVVKKMLLLK